MLTRILVLALLVSRDTPARQDTFTNDDLARIAPLSAETGGRSAPAVDIPAPAPRRAEKPGREPYWRAEARRIREKVRALDERAIDLRQRIEDRRRKPGVLPYSDEQIRRWEQQARDLVAKGVEMENDLQDRARREGALPGWLR